MSPRPLRIDQALDLVPDLDELLPLRDALIGASRGDEERAWAASEAYATIDTRLADADALEARIPVLVEEAARRTKTVYGHVARALRLAGRGDAAGAAHALIAAGEVEEGASRLAAAEAHFRKALELGRKPRDRRAEGLALLRLGRVARARGEYQPALRLYREGFEVAEAQRDVEGMVVACQGLGNVAFDLGRWEEAARWWRRGVELLGDRAPSRALWQLQSNLSVVARRVGDLVESRRWLDEAARTVSTLDDAAGRVFLDNAEGLLWAAEGEPRRAEASYREGLQAEPDPAARATLLENLAACLLAQGRPREAESAAREMERIAMVHRLTRILPHVYRTLGAVARERGDPEGFLFYEQALELCRESHASPLELALTQHEYGRLEMRSGNLGAALARLREAERIASELGLEPELRSIRADLQALAPPTGQAPEHTDEG